MIDPQFVADILAPTGTFTATATSSLGGPIKPIPTVIPTPTEWQTADKDGHLALWVVFVIFLVISASFAGLSWRVPVPRRLIHVATTLVAVVATLSYFAMASGQGKTFHCDPVTDHHDKVPDTRHLVCREVYWARYADWAITTPLLLVDLCLLAGVDGAHTLMAVVADVIMVLAGLFAALGREHTAQKWGWFTIACVSFLVVIWHVGVHGSRSVKARNRQVVRLFGGLGSFTLLLWIAYLIVWGVADEARLATVNSGIYAYAVLDILAKGVFGFWLLLTHRSVPETNAELGGYWAHGLPAEGRIRIGDDDVA